MKCVKAIEEDPYLLICYVTTQEMCEKLSQ